MTSYDLSAPAGCAATPSTRLLSMSKPASIASRRFHMTVPGPAFRWIRESGTRGGWPVFVDRFELLAELGDGSFDGPDRTFRGWLRTVARSNVADSFRRKGKEPDAAGGTGAQFRFNQLEDGEPVAGTDDDSDEAGLSGERRGLFRRALELIQRDFEDRTWNAFWKVAVEGRPTADVADELGMKPGTVRVSRCGVLARLREEFGDLIDADNQD